MSAPTQPTLTASPVLGDPCPEPKCGGRTAHIHSRPDHSLYFHGKWIAPEGDTFENHTFAGTDEMHMRVVPYGSTVKTLVLPKGCR